VTGDGVPIYLDPPHFNLKCSGFGPCLALVGIGRSNQYWLLPGKCSGELLDDLSPTLSLSNSNSTPHPWDIVPGVLVDIKKSLNGQKRGQAIFLNNAKIRIKKKVACPLFCPPWYSVPRCGFELLI